MGQQFNFFDVSVYLFCMILICLYLTSAE